MTATNKRDRFVRVAENRTQKVLDALQSLANCSDKSMYDYSDRDVEQIINAIEDSVEKLRVSFERNRPRDRFSLTQKSSLADKFR